MTVIDALALGATLASVLYGAYVVLFILYLIGLFGLCTLAFCLDISSDYFSVVPDALNQGISDKLNDGSMVMFSIVDPLAQMILLYRCWIVWDRRWVVVALPGFLALVSLSGGLAFIGVAISPPQVTEQEIHRLYLAMGILASTTSLAANTLSTLLLVTKILLFSREVHFESDSNSHRSLRIVTAMLVESGLLMFAFQLVFVVLFSLPLDAIDAIYGPAIQIYGITPTLLSLRVVMGSAYNKSTQQTKTNTLKFAHSRGVATQIADSGMGESQVIDIELDEISDSKRAADAAV